MEKKSVGLLELETAVLECFLEKTPLSPLGVNIIAIKYAMNILLFKWKLENNQPLPLTIS
jgi:hypothetical protein